MMKQCLNFCSRFSAIHSEGVFKYFRFVRFNNSSASDDNKSKLSPLKSNLQAVLNNSSPLKGNQNEETVFATTPYPEGTVFSQFTQASHSLRPKCDPQSTSIILFPGQGTQYVGMGKNLMQYSIAREMFESASEILGYNLLKICTNGPIEKLNETKYCQPAVVVCSLAAIERLKEENPAAINNCIATAGFSVGEISALVFAGSLSFERAISIVKIRAEAMQYCSEMIPGGMITVLLGADSLVSDACRDAKEYCFMKGVNNPECSVANYLYPSAKVLAGHTEALNFIINNSQKYKIRRISKLPVSGAFHTRLMEPASEAVYAALRKAPINDPIISVHRNMDGKRYLDANAIRRDLPKQLCRPVKWEQIMHIIYERPIDEAFPNTFECGPGKSLSTILKKVNAKAASFTKSISD